MHWLQVKHAAGGQEVQEADQGVQQADDVGEGLLQGNATGGRGQVRGGACGRWMVEDD